MTSSLTGSIISRRYHIGEKVAESKFSTVFRAKDLNLDISVALKLLPRELCRPEHQIRFRTEAEILKDLDHPHIVKILDAGSLDNAAFDFSYYMAMEYVEGFSLDKWGERSQAGIDDKVSLLVQITKALSAVHSKRIIHGDLKPGNILVETKDSPQAKVLDFGLSRIKDTNVIDNETDIRGTFQYMSPEQIGLLRRKVDERSDLYSLGIIAYQLLTGVHPFSTVSLSTMLHEQIAKPPDTPSLFNPDIPPVLDMIILKLLKKDPDRRYQSSIGLHADLEQYASGDLDFFVGEKDVSHLFHFTTHLVGRDQELKQLKKLCDMTRSSTGSVCFIAGEPGIGKTRLLNEFREFALTQKFSVCEGRCLERNSKMPWGLFRDSLSDYMKVFQRYDMEKKRSISHSLKKKCSELGKIITDLYPPAQEILGQCPKTAKVTPEQEMIRSCMALSTFTFSLSEAENGLLVLLDDLQWADVGSLKLIEEIARNIYDKPLLIVGTYRNNEVDKDHALHNLLYLEEKRYTVEQLFLTSFTEEEMKVFIRYVLNMDEPWIIQLAAFLYRRSLGNPFHAFELLHHLIMRNHLTRENNSWQLRTKDLTYVSLPDTLTDMLLGRVRSLDYSVQQVLQIAAIIGKRFDMELLIQVITDETAGTPQRTIQAIDLALENRLIEENFLKKGEMVFVHDRIREAFYSVMPQKERQEFHYWIGLAIERMHQKNISDVLFDLAYHFTESDRDEKILKYAYPAGRQANIEYAYDDAIKYYSIVQTILEKDLDSNRQDWIVCNEELAKTRLNARQGKDALSLLKTLLPFRKDPQQKAVLYNWMTKAYIVEGEYRSSEEPARMGLQLIGEWLPVGKTGILIGTLKELFLLWFHPRKPDGPGAEISTVSKQKDRVKIEFYKNLLWTYHVYDFWKAPRVVLRMLNLGEYRIGPSPELAHSLMYYAMLCGILRFYNKAFAKAERAASMAKDMKNEWLMQYGDLILGFLFTITGRYRKALEYFTSSHLFFIHTKEINELCTANMGNALCHAELGEFQHALKKINMSLRVASSTADEILLSHGSGPGAIYANLGDYDRAEASLMPYRHLQDRLFEQCTISITLCRINLEQTDYHKALEYLQEAIRLDKQNSFMQHLVTEIHNLYPEVLLGEYLTRQGKRTATASQQNAKQFKKIDRLCKIALKKNRIYPMHYGGALKVMASCQAAAGNFAKADMYYKKAIAHHETFKQRYKLARIRYAYGMFLKDTGRQERARTELENAYMLFDQMEVPYWKEKTEAILGIRLADATSKVDIVEEKRKQAVLDFGKEISTSHNVDDLSGLVMKKALEITGAQAGGIFLSKKDFNAVFLDTWRGINTDLEPVYSQTIVDAVFNSGKPIITTNAETDDTFSDQISVSRSNIKSILCMPLKYNDLINGVCYLQNNLAEGVFFEKDVDLLGKLLSQAAVAIENLFLTEKLANLETNGVDTQIESPPDKKVQDLIDYIKQHFTEEVSRETLARQCDLNPDYLGKLFKRQLGKSIREYVNELRIEFVADELKHPGKKIIDIAFDAGFESLRTFNRIFYRVMGETPTRYRESNIVKPT
ncbi:MAG: protein kinase [Desulfobacteraceae bacterium]|nr:protein kinase [Desulfobacteraceae bacterium]MBC2754193.1 protein kinase [Desulfobacteraceae bacterium]